MCNENYVILVMYVIYGYITKIIYYDNDNNYSLAHTTSVQCLVNRKSGKLQKFLAWRRNTKSGMKNGWQHCHDTTSNCMTSTGQASCAKLHRKDNGEPLDVC